MSISYFQKEKAFEEARAQSNPEDKAHFLYVRELKNGEVLPELIYLYTPENVQGIVFDLCNFSILTGNSCLFVWSLKARCFSID